MENRQANFPFVSYQMEQQAYSGARSIAENVLALIANIFKK